MVKKNNGGGIPRTRKPIVVRSRSLGEERAASASDDNINDLREALAEAAQIYFSETAVTAEQHVPFSACHFDDVSVRSGIPIIQIEEWLREYEQAFAGTISWPERMISQDGVRKLMILSELERQGVDREQIARIVAPARNGSLLQERIGEMLNALERVGQQRERDKHLFLKELHRTREEIQHLRYELVAGLPRRTHRRGFWSKLVGS